MFYLCPFQVRTVFLPSPKIVSKGRFITVYIHTFLITAFNYKLFYYRSKGFRQELDANLIEVSFNAITL